MVTTINENPTANICFGKNRLKVYEGKKIYLKDQQEFALEMFNPTQNDILAKISLDGTELSGGGIVVRPGERVFLDRYLDKAQKFKFSTYEVGNSTAVQNAIRENGKVKVTFHKEYVYTPSYNSGITWTNTSPNYYSSPNWGGTNNFFCSSGTTGSASGASTLTSAVGTVANCSSASATFDFAPLNEEVKSEPAKKETGRIEAGSKSNQELVHINKNFDYYAFATSEYQILPESVKTYTSSDIRVYCTGCGKKANKSDKFCSACGQKI